MLIDFHAHIFPDALAPKAIAALKAGMLAAGGKIFPERADGTLGGLLRVMESENVDITVIMPIVTAPNHAAAVNRFALAARSQTIAARGGTLPSRSNNKIDARSQTIAARGGVLPEQLNNKIDARSQTIAARGVALIMQSENWTTADENLADTHSQTIAARDGALPARSNNNIDARSQTIAPHGGALIMQSENGTTADKNLADAHSQTIAPRDGALPARSNNNIDARSQTIATHGGALPARSGNGTDARPKIIVAFGGVHPAQTDIDETLENLAAAGVIGVKLHPEFQETPIDSPGYIHILKKCAALGLLALIHTGADVGYRPPWRCTPVMLARALDSAPGARAIAAHLGGMELWDDAVKYLAGRDMYFDTAYVHNFINPAACRDIIRELGVERTLFGSDFPWTLPRTESLSFLKQAGFTAPELAMITHENALKLLSRPSAT